MIDKILDVLSKGVTVRQHDFVKSLLVAFPLVYCVFDILNPQFLCSDIFTRCMYVVATCILLNSLSLCFLWVIHWLARCPIWNGVFYFIAPIIFTAVDFDAPSGGCDNYTAVVAESVLYHYAVFFSPFLLYAFCLSVYYRITHKPDNRPNPIAPDNSNEYSNEESEYRVDY